MRKVNEQRDGFLTILHGALISDTSNLCLGWGFFWSPFFSCSANYSNVHELSSVFHCLLLLLLHIYYIHMYIHIYIYMQMYIYVYVLYTLNICIYVYIDIDIHTCIHTYIHTYIHTSGELIFKGPCFLSKFFLNIQKKYLLR